MFTIMNFGFIFPSTRATNRALLAHWVLSLVSYDKLSFIGLHDWTNEYYATDFFL